MVVTGLLAFYSFFFVNFDCVAGTNWLCEGFGVNEKSNLLEKLGWIGAGEISIYLAVVASRRANAEQETARAHHETAKAHHKTASLDRFRGGQDAFRKGDRVAGAQSMLLSSLEYGMEDYAEEVSGEVCKYIREETSSKLYRDEHPKDPSEEIYYLLELMFVGRTERQKKNVDKFWRHAEADLSESYLAGCDLEGANFKGARLIEVCFNSARLRQARFYGANLVRSKFVCSRLSGATFMGADLTQSRFLNATLTEARFQGSCLLEAKFICCSLDRTEFMGVEMPYAWFLSCAPEMPTIQMAHLEDSEELRRLTKLGMQIPELQRWWFRGAFTGLQVGIKGKPNRADFLERLWKGVNLKRGKPLRLNTIVLEGGISDRWRARIGEEIAELYRGGNELKEDVDEGLRHHRLTEKFGIKLNEKWDNKPRKVNRCTEKEIKGWEKDYDDNRKTEFSPEALGKEGVKKTNPNATKWPLLPPDKCCIANPHKASTGAKSS